MSDIDIGRNAFFNASTLSSQQVKELNDSQLESLTNSAKEIYILAKVKQVEKLEAQLEKLETKKEKEIENHQSKKPGRLASKEQKKEWDKKSNQLNKELKSITLKKSVVQVVKESMYMGSPKIEYLAEKKMRFFETDLTGISDTRNQQNRQARLSQDRSVEIETQSQSNSQNRVNTRTRSRSIMHDND